MANTEEREQQLLQQPNPNQTGEEFLAQIEQIEWQRRTSLVLDVPCVMVRTVRDSRGFPVELYIIEGRWGEGKLVFETVEGAVIPESEIFGVKTEHGVPPMTRFRNALAGYIDRLNPDWREDAR